MDIETSRLEYKRELSKGFVSEVVAFLNTREGGTIYVGVDDAGKNYWY